MTHLWEAKHAYYCSEGYYDETYNSWQDFVDDLGSMDFDYNLVFRWDWQVPDPADYEPEPVPPTTLNVYWVQQRKGQLASASCVITEADEAAARAWLQARWEYLAKLWAPLELTATPEEKS